MCNIHMQTCINKHVNINKIEEKLTYKYIFKKNSKENRTNSPA